MKFIKKATENEMIATFLKAEANSKRFGENLLSVLEKLNIRQEIITFPDTKNKHENEMRKRIIAEHRGYGINQDFENFPAIKNIRNGVCVYNQSNTGFIEASKALERGESFHPMILVTTHDKENIVVLEGHLRLTAYMLEPKSIPEEIEAIIGYSSKKELEDWGLY